MATIYDLKPRFQNMLRPLCAWLVSAGVTANQVTLTACGASILWGLWIHVSSGSASSLFLLPLFLIVRMALNAIDGMMAREFSQKSRLGAVLNELTDVIADAALYLPFAAIAGLPSLPVILIVCLGIISEMTGVVSVQIGSSRRYDGPFGKSDRAFYFGLGGFLLGTGLLRGGILVDIALWAGVILAGLTIFNRAQKALSERAQP